VGFIRRLNNALDNGIAKRIFDHIRNYLICSFLLAIGVFAMKQQSGLILGYFVVHYAGGGIILLSVLLFCLNLYDGMRQIASLKYGRSLMVLLTILYVFVALRVIELAASFRTGLNPY
jgi:hypothetical protein